MRGTRRSRNPSTSTIARISRNTAETRRVCGAQGGEVESTLVGLVTRKLRRKLSGGRFHFGQLGLQIATHDSHAGDGRRGEEYPQDAGQRRSGDDAQDDNQRVKAYSSSDDGWDEEVQIHLLEHAVQSDDDEGDDPVWERDPGRSAEQCQERGDDKPDAMPQAGKELEQPGEHTHGQGEGQANDQSAHGDDARDDEDEDELPAEEGAPDRIDFSSQAAHVLSQLPPENILYPLGKIGSVLHQVERDYEDEDGPDERGQDVDSEVERLTEQRLEDPAQR